MTQPQGIDLANSGWDNPEGYTPRERDRGPEPVPDDICGDQHPNGWACELKPGHRPVAEHWADDGNPGGIRWTRALVDTSTLADLALSPDRRPFVQGGIISQDRAPFLEEIGLMARDALANPNPAAWAVALNRIVERIYG